MIKQTRLYTTRFMARLNAVPKKYYIGIGVVVFVALLVWSFWPRTVTFSYSGQSCITQPLLLPGLLKGESSDFSLETERQFRVSGVELAAGKVCVKQRTAPTQGSYLVTLSPFGIPIGTIYRITVPELPKASIEALSKPVPVSKPVILKLNQPDAVFSYVLKIGDKTANCRNQQQTLRCDVGSLALNQGAEYGAELQRYYKKKKVATLASRSIQTLTAASVSATSIQRDEMVYAKPKTLDVTFDKNIESAQVSIVRTDDDAKAALSATSTSKDNILTVSWTEDLARSATYELVIDKVVAADGSSLVEPYKLPFKVSGGPKVTNISIPRSGVALGSTAVITFDQPLSDKQDIAPFVQLAGGATYAGKQGNQVRVNLAGVGKCSDFSIKLTNDIASQHDVAGHSGWSFAGRTICHSVSTIGYSAKGRAITAYTFGSGPSAIVYTGAIHGNEVSTRSLMLRWIDELEANARAIPADKTIVVVPAINPDGVASGTRTNARNVDLNRNFATADWRSDITTVTNAPFPKGGGATPMSEPESKAIAAFIGRLSPRLVLSYHSIGGVVIANQAGISNAYTQTYVGLSGYRNATGSGTTFDYSISGTADDYYAEKLGVASIVIELGSHTYHQFERNQKAMWAMMK